MALTDARIETKHRLRFALEACVPPGTLFFEKAWMNATLLFQPLREKGNYYEVPFDWNCDEKVERAQNLIQTLKDAGIKASVLGEGSDFRLNIELDQPDFERNLTAFMEKIGKPLLSWRKPT